MLMGLGFKKDRKMQWCKARMKARGKQKKSIGEVAYYSSHFGWGFPCPTPISLVMCRSWAEEMT